MDAIGCYFIGRLQMSLWIRTKDGTRLMLKDKERDIFANLYGLYDGRMWKHQEIADHFNLSRERIRQLEVKVFRKFSCKKKQEDGPVKQMLALLTRKETLPSGGNGQMVHYLHEFHTNHLPEWDEARFFHFVEYLLPMKGLSELWKKNLKSQKSIRNPKDILNYIGDKIIWPPTTVYFPKSYIQSFLPKRGMGNKDGEDGMSLYGTFYSKKLERNVFYESKLEERFFKLLERSTGVYAYCEQPFTLSFEINGKGYRYTPDVLLQLEDGRCLVAEIKPLMDMVIREVQTKFQQLHEYCREQGWGVILCDGYRDVTALCHYPQNQPFDSALLRILSEKRRLMAGDIRSLKEAYGGNSLHLFQCILRYDLSYREFPTLLWHAKGGGICAAIKDRVVWEENTGSMAIKEIGEGSQP